MEKPHNPIESYNYCPHCSNPLTSKKVDQEIIKDCENCGFIFWNKSKPVVSMLTLKDNKILMLPRAQEPLKDYWCFPGGFISYYETPENGIIREVKEEIGVKPIIKKILGVYQIDNDPRGIHLDITYLGEINNEPKASNEHQRIDFFKQNDLPEKIAWKHGEAIHDWINMGGQYKESDL